MIVSEQLTFSYYKNMNIAQDNYVLEFWLCTWGYCLTGKSYLLPGCSSLADCMFLTSFTGPATEEHDAAEFTVGRLQDSLFTVAKISFVHAGLTSL